MGDLELSSPRAQRYQVAQAQGADGEIQGKRRGDGSQGYGQPLAAQMKDQPIHKPIVKRLTLNFKPSYD